MLTWGITHNALPLKFIEGENVFPADFPDGHTHVSLPIAATRGDASGPGRTASRRSTPTSSHCQAVPTHNVRGPNWTEAEMFVLIGQKRIEWNGRYNCNQPSLAKFVYGTTAWKLVLAGCMSVVGFRARDADQITNKWDGLIKNYKKLKDYIEGTGLANWWGMSREEKKELSKTRKMLLEFSEAMYTEMEGFVGRRQIFGRATDDVDSDRPAPSVPRSFRHSTPTSHGPSSIGVESPIASTTAASQSPTTATAWKRHTGVNWQEEESHGHRQLGGFCEGF